MCACVGVGNRGPGQDDEVAYKRAGCDHDRLRLGVLPKWRWWDFLQESGGWGGGVMERGQRVMAVSFISWVLSVPAWKTAPVPCPSWAHVNRLQLLGGLPR